MTTVVLSGLATGAIYAFIAIGYHVTLIWSGTMNFAQAQFLVLGTFIAYWGTGQLGLPGWVVVLIAAAICLILGLLEERIAIWPLSSRFGDGHGELITTIGFSTIMVGLMLTVWGPEPHQLPFLIGSNESFELFGGRVLPIEIFILVLAVVLPTAIYLFAKYTRFGLAGLARSSDAEAATIRGINVRMLSFAAFGVAALIGGVVGVVVGARTLAVAEIGTILAVKGFVAITLGGVGSLKGAVIGGLAIGLAEALAGRYIGSEYANIFVFVAFLLVLLVAPRGLFGRRVARVV